ncbi:MAG TPA: hypothetical protein VGY55_05505 [Pirellulales bacterium]|nr:hypothetical protein [Pirellulales bacterium]
MPTHKGGRISAALFSAQIEMPGREDLAVGKGETKAERLQTRPAEQRIRATVGIVAPVAGLVGAWIAAGSVGLIGHPLRHALAWLVMAAVVVSAWPCEWRPWRRTAVWIAGIIAAIGMTASSLVVVNIMAMSLLLAAVAMARPEADRPLRAAASAAAILGLYRLALTSIPPLWLAADRAGGAIGEIAGRITGQPLNVGATFGGLDFLVGMVALYAIWLIEMPRPRWRLAARGAAGIAIAQLCYLIILSEAPNLVDALTAPAAPAAVAGTVPAEKVATLSPTEWIRRWASEVAPWKELLPWNLPALAALLQAGVAAAMLDRLRASRAAGVLVENERSRQRRSQLLTPTAAALAALVPAVIVLAPYRATLEGRKIVAFEKGLLNWDKPVHGQYGRLMIGMYGLFGPFVESLGGSFQRSADLSEQDLKGSDLLVLFYPTREMNEDQLKRVQDYVTRGGKLLLMCDHTGREPVHEGDPFQLRDSRFNDLLKPTSIRVAFDAAEFTVGGWLESYEALAHPTTLGIPDHRNVFGVVIGASLEIGWPAQPLLIGRWGYSDIGDEGTGPAMLGNQRYDPGEKLGDLVLAAEQPWGEGRVLVFGDTSTLNNGIVIGSHPFAARLLAYMAGNGKTSWAPLREAAGGILAALLIVLLCWRPSALRAAAVAAALSASLAICVAMTAAATELLPGKPAGGDSVPKETDKSAAAATSSAGQPLPVTNDLAYIDYAHLGSFSEEITRPEGIFGFEYALMRDGYLVLTLYDVTYERLSKAGLFATIGPQRPFTGAERQAIRRFVEEGGIFILMAGYDRSAASGALLDDFGFKIGAIPPNLPKGTEPAPMGHFKGPYYEVSGDYQSFVRFHAAWPISCNDPEAKAIAAGFADRPFDPAAGGFRLEGKTELPVIIVRNVKKGKAVVIGDTEFAANKNLENEDGSPIEGLRENADFWRWFIPQLRGTTPWYPPKSQPQTTPAATPPTGAVPAAAIPELPAALPPVPEAKDKKQDDAEKQKGEKPDNTETPKSEKSNREKPKSETKP